MAPYLVLASGFKVHHKERMENQTQAGRQEKLPGIKWMQLGMSQIKIDQGRQKEEIEATCPNKLFRIVGEGCWMLIGINSKSGFRWVQLCAATLCRNIVPQHCAGTEISMLHRVKVITTLLRRKKYVPGHKNYVPRNIWNVSVPRNLLHDATLCRNIVPQHCCIYFYT